MSKLNILKDASEIVHYNNPNIPLYIKSNKLSDYTNMTALCHWHEDIEYIKAEKGYMFYDVNGEKILINEQDALLVNSKQMHYGFSRDKTDCYFICILFRVQLLANNLEIINKYIQPIIENPNLQYFYLSSSNIEQVKLIKIFDKIYEQYHNKEAGFEMMILSNLNIFWANWYQMLLPNLISYSTPIDENLFIQRNMVSFIYKNYTLKLSLKDIADSGNVCRSKCCEIFKKYLNKTPIGFLNTYRLEVSMRLLTDTQMSITEIALSCGFQSSSYYSEIFLHYKGCTPSNYRLQQMKLL